MDRIMNMQMRLSRRTVQKLALALPPSMLLSTHGRALAQEATPGALPADVQQFAEDTYAFVNGGYISLFIVTDDGVIAIGSGGNFALAAARVLVKHSQLDARTIAEESMRAAASLCVYTNEQLTFEELS